MVSTYTKLYNHFGPFLIILNSTFYKALHLYDPKGLPCVKRFIVKRDFLTQFNLNNCSNCRKIDKLPLVQIFLLGFDYALLKPIPSKYAVGKGFVEKWVPLDGLTTRVSLNQIMKSAEQTH